MESINTTATETTKTPVCTCPVCGYGAICTDCVWDCPSPDDEACSDFEHGGGGGVRGRRLHDED